MRYDIQELQTDDIKSAKGMSMHPFLQLPRPTDFSVSSLLTAGNGATGASGHNSSTTSGIECVCRGNLAENFNFAFVEVRRLFEEFSKDAAKW